MAFDPSQLDEIRARLKVSEVVGSRFELARNGVEFVVKDNSSFTVNDRKGFWCEFGKDGDGKPHDVFDFLQIYEGFTFVGAVEELARKAGVALARRPGGSPAAANGAQEPRPARAGANGVHALGESGPGGDRAPDGLAGAEQAKGRREVVATWDYLSPENELLYQVVRMQERLPDGSWRLTREGKTWKTFLQRRPSPDGDGAWINGLDVVDRKSGQPLEFMRYKAGWLRFDQQKFEEWGLTERRTFEGAGNVEHWLYNANAVIDELQEAREDQRTIFLPEGERKVDALREWGLLAVTNSGGAKHFTESCAEFFRGARHVVLLQDNDRAGAERVAKVAPMLAAVGVELVTYLNFRDVWPACPAKGDVLDWRDAGGGTREQLLEVVDGLKPWTPEPYRSRYGAKTGRDLNAPARSYPWRIKYLVPAQDDLLIMGPSRSGKTFEALDMLMHVHFGKQFAGKKVTPGGFVYLTYEGATGFENRLRAYMIHHGISSDDLHSFAWLTRPPNLFANEDNVVGLAEEIAEISRGFRLPLAASIVDTHNSASRGSSEIKSDDINRIMANYATIRERTAAPLWIIGHTNAEGKHRGNEQFFNNIEAALLVERVQDKHGVDQRDDDGRVRRRVRVSKQREGDDRVSWEFVLAEVKIGVDEDDDDISSMVSVEPAQKVTEGEVREHRDGYVKPDAFHLRGNNVDVFRALLKVMDARGVPPPPALGLPSGVRSVVQWHQLGSEYKKMDPQEQNEDLERYRNRIKARTRRFREDLLRYNVIGLAEMVDPGAANDDPSKPKMLHYVWPTGQRVFGKGLQWPPPAPRKMKNDGPIIDQATGLPITSLDDTVF